MRFYGFIALTIFFREPENILRFTRDLGITIKYASLFFNNQNTGNSSTKVLQEEKEKKEREEGK